MALDRLTKVDGGGISTTSDYRVGIITATKFVGPIEGDVTGSITATDGTFSGNVTIGGTLTYEDVTNIDSVGIITAQSDIHVGAGVSVVGIVTATTFKGDGDFVDIDVDGHTNLDRVSIAGVTTISADLNVATTLNINSVLPKIVFNDTNNENDFYVANENGSFRIRDIDNPTDRYRINSSGTIHEFFGVANFNSHLTVDGNLSVGGVLTYEDVTNVDSVGLITARNGISVTSGGITVLGGTITGTATTATTITVASDTTDTLCFPIFTNTGVGNNGPKVNTSKLSFNSSTGALSATSFVGDGSNLTGITQTTINNNADNRVITGSGTANTLEAESGLTYNGTTLQLAAADDIRIAGGAWTGEYTGGIKIQPDASNAYIQYHGSLYFRNSGGANRLQLNSAGNATFTGLVTASGGFSGDGSSISNVNATTLDSIDSGSFLRSDANDTASGQITLTSSSQYPLDINSSNDGKIVLRGTNNPYIRFRESNSDKAYMQWNADGYLEIYNEETSRSIRLKSGTNGLIFNEGGTERTVWHSGNDGVGSGLDADTLDGTQGTDMIRSGAQSSVGGWHISAYRNGSGTSPHLYFSHASGYGMHINTYNTNSGIYALECHNGTKNLFNVQNDGSTRYGGSAYPWTNNSYDLGTASYRWRNIYTNDLNLSNEGGKNDVDGTWGNYTIQEGESDLFLINKRNGKKYKFNLTEVS